MNRASSIATTLLLAVRGMVFYFLAFSYAYAAEPDTQLTDRQKAIIPIAALTAAGNTQALERALNDGLNNGLTVNEVKEIFIHSYAYAGFPRALNGINTFIKVSEHRKEQGLSDKLGNEATPLPSDYNANAYGHKTRNELVGRDISNRTSGYAAFVPTIDTFLVEHLFADIFYRDVLSIKDRELVTISMLSAMAGAEAQLTSHLKLSMRVGYTAAQLRQFTHILQEAVSEDSAIRARNVLNDKMDITFKDTHLADVEVNTDQSRTIGSPDKFTGKAVVSSRFASPVGDRYRGAMVEFEAGARTAWHTHPKGQTLIIISGKGLVQREGSETRAMLPGNVITIAPNTRHWHGAAPDSKMSHIAISPPDNGETVTWMELVTD
ncbi:(R)-mandelonitrile lyase [Alteromonas lipotrueiana]|uniref:(R)-mandelonitrile lyase n=1 Tax=Alteromonas lipotrueiana TaxID=2803815 RepID=UPI001FE8E029|nr:carboxymuconolactone decarboxylase family protein [Alteromonas lipotrueiana]